MATNSTFNPAHNPNNPTASFYVVLVVCIFIAIAVFLLYSYLRKKVLKIYTPRTLLLKEEYSLGKFSNAFFAWVLPAFRVSDDEVFSKAGLDAVVYLRFLRLCLKIALLTLPYGLFVLIPVNSQGALGLSDGLSRISTSNIAKGSSKLWAHWLAVWVYSLIIFYFFHLEWKVFISYRQAYLSKCLGKHFALFMTNIPEMFDDEEALEKHLNAVLQEKVFGVQIIRDLSKWDALISRHDALVMKWERATATAEESEERWVPKYAGFGEKIDNIVRYEKELELLRNRLEAEQLKKGRSKRCAFVFFHSLQARTIALQTVWSEVPSVFEAIDIPDRLEVVWENIGQSLHERYIRLWLARCVVFLLVLFYIVPIAFVASLANLKSVAVSVKFLDKIATGSSAVLTSLLQAFLPVALMRLLKRPLTMLLKVVARHQGHLSKSSIDLQAFKYLVIFNIFNTFFIFIISGSLLQNLYSVVKAPLSIPALFATSLPNQANFYINFIMLMTVVGHGIQLLRGVTLTIYLIRNKFLVKTTREKLETWKPGNAPYTRQFALGVLFFLIGLSYSVLSPVIIPFVVIYFFVAHVVWTNQLLRVYIPSYEHEGRFWPPVFTSMMVGVVIFQLLMIGVLSLKESYVTTALLTPLVLLTYVFWYVTCRNYARVTEFLVLRDPDLQLKASEDFLQRVKNSYIRNVLVPSVRQTSSDCRKAYVDATEGANGDKRLARPIGSAVCETVAQPLEENSNEDNNLNL